MPDLEAAIEHSVGEVSIDSLDISFGEIISLFKEKELIIQPEFQRLFRWTEAQQSRLIESIILGLPIPQIFVIQNPDGVLELIDGLQRISSVIHFIEPAVLPRPPATEDEPEFSPPSLFDGDDELMPPTQSDDAPLRLGGCDIVQELNGLTFADLPLVRRLELKRSFVRMVVVTRKSKPRLRYQMFKRLNTGGLLLSYQEIRNCTSRMAGDAGVKFYMFLKDLASFPAFLDCTSTLPDETRVQKGDEELVLRFLAGKNALDSFAGSVKDWLDGYLEQVALEQQVFDYAAERVTFERLFSYLSQMLGAGAFVFYNGDGRPIGGLKPAYFEAVALGVLPNLDALEQVNYAKARSAIVRTIQSPEFRAVTGPGANSKPKLTKRIELVQDALRGVLQ